MPYAEALLFVDDYEPQVVKRRLRREYGVGSYDDVARSCGETLESAAVGACGLKARYRLYPDRRAVEARREGLEMLLGQHRGRGEDCGLPAVHGDDVRRAHGDLRLAVAGVAAHQPVHWLRRGEVGLDGGNRGELVGRLLVGERGVERLAAFAMDVVGEPGDDFALRLGLEQRRREVGDGFLGVGLVLAPALAVEFVQAHFLSFDADIPRQQMGVRRRHVELGAFGVFDGEDLAAFAVHLDFGGTDEASNAVVDVHDVFTRLQIVEIVQPYAAGMLPPGRAGLALGENAVGFGDDGKPGEAFRRREFESARKFVRLQNDLASRARGGEMAGEPGPGGLEKLRMVRFVRAEFAEARQRRCLEAVRRDAGGRRVAGVDDLHAAGRRVSSEGGAERVGVVVEREYGGPLGQHVGECRGSGVRRALLVRRHDFRGVHAGDRALGRRVEGAQALEGVAEELGADRELVAGAPDVHDAAADRPVAFFFHRRRAVVAESGQAVAVSGKGCRGTVAFGRDCKPARRTLGHRGANRGERCDDDARIRIHGPRAQRGERLEPRAKGGLVAVERRRQLEKPRRQAGGDGADVVRQTIGVRQAGRDGENDAARLGPRGEGQREKCVRAACRGRKRDRPGRVRRGWVEARGE